MPARSLVLTLILWPSHSEAPPGSKVSAIRKDWARVQKEREGEEVEKKEEGEESKDVKQEETY